MRRPRSFLASALVLCVPLHLPASDDAQDPDLLVMLQGDDLAAIREGVRASGARITHDLPVIRALGARMSAQQLDSVREHPAVERIIDDLAYDPAPEIEEDDDCPLAGALQLSWTGNVARWRLFNKGGKDLSLSRLALSWPGDLGTLRGAALGGRLLTTGADLEAESPLAIADNLGAISAGTNTTLTLEFASEPQDKAAAQSAISLNLEAGEECATELIPSYGAPESDTYFPTVSGAALLHHHGITGRGITIAVLDSGLWEEPDAIALDTRGAPRIIARYDAMVGEEVDATVDESGHGTHMTSVIADSGRVTRQNALSPSWRGIAPDVSLVAVKAFDSSGEAGFLDIVRGIQWVIKNRQRLGIRVLNLSFASRPRWPYWDDPVNQALMRAWDAGITVVAAAGNEGPDPMTVGSPGNLPYIITVGAITDSWTEEDRDDDYLPDFSSRGPTPTGHIKPDIVAYGGHIAGIMRPGATLGEQFPEYFMNDGSFVMTGTSQAAAVVSGLAALLLQAEPAVSNNDIKCMLMSSAEPAISTDGRLAYSPFLQGSGLVNVSRAITIGERGCGNEGLVLADDLQNRDHFQGPAEFHGADGVPTLPGQEELISSTPPEKGHSDSRRWGSSAHLERLLDPTAPSPIDWLGIYQSERARMEALAEKFN